MTLKLHRMTCVFSCRCPVVALQYKHVQEGLQKAGGKHALQVSQERWWVLVAIRKYVSQHGWQWTVWGQACLWSVC